MSIPIEQPPFGLDPEMQDYIVRQLKTIDGAIDGVYRWPITNQMPLKPGNGEIRYFGRALLPDITGPGFWAHENGLWVQYHTDARGDARYYLQSEVDAKDAATLAAANQYTDDEFTAHLAAYDPHPQYVLEGYGGLVKTTDTNYGSIGSGAWTTIDNWDEAMLLSPQYVVQDIANSGLRFEEQGIYAIGGTIAISFDDENRGREFGVRLWNDTQGVAGREVTYFVGRNQAGVNISQGALLIEIGAPEVNNLLQIQIAAIGDTFNPVTVVDALYSARRVGL